jgi:tellurite resistance protein TehA-like permease
MDWGMVFRLGMYTVCTYMMAKTMGLPWLEAVQAAFVYIALIAWSFTAINFFRSCFAKSDCTHDMPRQSCFSNPAYSPGSVLA